MSIHHLTAADRVYRGAIATRIYVVRCETTGRVKIGQSGNPPRRLKSLDIGCPTNLVLEKDVEATLWHEGVLHDRYAKYRVKGEWFELPPAELEELMQWTPEPVPQKMKRRTEVIDGITHHRDENGLVYQLIPATARRHQ